MIVKTYYREIDVEISVHAYLAAKGREGNYRESCVDRRSEDDAARAGTRPSDDRLTNVPLDDVVVVVADGDDALRQQPFGIEQPKSVD